MISIRNLIATAALALTATVASASTSWVNPAGSSDTITYTNGLNLNNVYGSPMVAEDKFLFAPESYTANESYNDVFDIGSVIVTAKPGHTLDKVYANTEGDWSLLGSASADHGAVLTVTNLSGPGVFSQNLTINPTMPTFDQGGLFSGNTLIDVPNSWTSVLIELSSYVHVGTETPSDAALMQMKSATIGVNTAAVPLPPALLAAPAAMVVGFIARRRATKR